MLLMLALMGIANASPQNDEARRALMARQMNVICNGLCVIIPVGCIGSVFLVWAMKPKQKTCPDCAERVPDKANKCKHCGYRFDG